MNREEIIAGILNRRIKDYSFPIVFFLIFSVFVFFAIRPNLVTAFSLQKELDELKIQDEQYERVILNIVEYQTIVEKTRDNVPVLSEAIPSSPEIFSMVRDIRNSASESGMVIDNLEISAVNLKQDKNAPSDQQPQQPVNPANTTGENNKKYTVTFRVASNFNEVKNFITRLVQQRRIKMIEEILITSSGQQGTQSATFNVSFTVDGFYL